MLTEEVHMYEEFDEEPIPAPVPLKSAEGVEYIPGNRKIDPTALIPGQTKVEVRTPSMVIGQKGDPSLIKDLGNLDQQIQALLLTYATSLVQPVATLQPISAVSAPLPGPMPAPDPSPGVTPVIIDPNMSAQVLKG